MANNTIQIKRSTSTATPASLNPGELAYSNATGGSGVLFIGSTDGATVVPIGGVRTPGTLTANQALVANSTSGINQVTAANVSVLSNLYVNGSVGTTGYVLFSGGGTTNTYWASPGSLTTNSASQYTWSNTQTFQNTITFSSTINVASNLVINSTALEWVGNTTTSPTVLFANTGVIQSGNSTVTASPQLVIANSIGTAVVNTNFISLGNSTSTGTQQFTLANSTGNVALTQSGISLATLSTTWFNLTTSNLGYIGQIAANSYVSGGSSGGSYGGSVSGFISNSIFVGIGNTTVNASMNTSSLSINGNLIANSTGANNAFNLNGVAASSYQLNSTLNANIASYLPTYTGVVNASSLTTGSGYLSTGGGATVNSSQISIGNTLNQYFLTSLGVTINSPTETTNYNNGSLNFNGNTTVATVFVNNAGFYLGNSTTTQTGSSITLANSTGNVVSSPTSVIVSNSSAAYATVNTSGIFAANVNVTQNFLVNGSVGTAGYVLFSGGGTTNTYWASPGSLTTNVNSQYNWSNTQTFTNTITFSSTLSVAANLVANSTALIWVGNTTTSPTVTFANTGVIQSGNSTVTASPQLIVANTLGTTTINTTSVGTVAVYATGLVNAANFVTTGTVNTGTMYATGIVNAANFVTTGTVNTGTLYATGLVNGANFVTTGTVNTGTMYATSTVNALSYNTGGGFGSATGGVIANSTVVAVGNSTVNVSINSTAFNGTSNNALYLGGTLASGYQLNSTLNANIASYLPTYTGVVNASSLTIGTSASLNSTAIAVGTIGTTSGYIANTTVISIGNSTVNTTANSTHFFSGNSTVYGFTNSTAEGFVNTVGNNVTTPVSIVISNSTAAYTTANLSGIYTAGVVNASSLSVGTAFIANTSNVVFTGGAITATSANLSIQNMTVSGNLTVTGTVVAINSSQLVVNDNIIELADGNVTTDVVDTGLFSPAGNSTSTWYSGLARIAAKSSNNNPYFWFFGSNTNPNTASTIDTSSNTLTATVQAYLAPYGTGGAFIANSSVVNITANSTVSAAIVANSLTLSTALSAAYGGTGQLGGYTAGDILYATGASALSKLSVPGSVANGQVLQITNNLPAYGVLDGGTF